jgi:hypothetical protein
VSPLPDESVKKKNELLRQVTELKDKEITFKQWKKVQDDSRDEKTYLKCEIVLRNKMYSTYTTIRIKF